MKLVGWEHLLDDLNLIIRDIRESHKKDSESAPQTTVADELRGSQNCQTKLKSPNQLRLHPSY